MTLMSKIPSCRGDYIHFIGEDEHTPVLLEWLIFYNILLENAIQSGQRGDVENLKIV
jgi:hypothetical protein